MERKIPALIPKFIGITKTYEAVTNYCGFAERLVKQGPYGKPNDNIPCLKHMGKIV